jgi:hypothetical protein
VTLSQEQAHLEYNVHGAQMAVSIVEDDESGSNSGTRTGSAASGTAKPKKKLRNSTEGGDTASAKQNGDPKNSRSISEDGLPDQAGQTTQQSSLSSAAAQSILNNSVGSTTASSVVIANTQSSSTDSHQLQQLLDKFAFSQVSQPPSGSAAPSDPQQYAPPGVTPPAGAMRSRMCTIL